MGRVKIPTEPHEGWPEYRAAPFSEHAAPQAIEAWLKIARLRQEHTNRYVAWLEELLAERNAQVAAGTWPTIKARESQ